MKIFFTVCVLCSLRLFKLKTEGQTIQSENLTEKLQNRNQTSLLSWVSLIGLRTTRPSTLAVTSILISGVCQNACVVQTPNCTKSGNLPLFNSSFCSCFNMCRDKRTTLNYYFHDFSCTTIKFYDISGLENERLEFRLSRFSSMTSASPNEYLRIHSSKVCKCRGCIAHSVFTSLLWHLVMRL